MLTLVSYLGYILHIWLMISFPHAKINLGLYVTEKRLDGYHNISSCFYPIGWSDALEIIPSPSLNFSSSGLAIPGNVADNLCMKAYELLQKKFDLPPVKIHLHKVIPTGAGLGGGSSDGAFVLKTLNKIFELSLKEEALEDYAGMLGSDCPFFIKGKPVVATGTGNIFEPVALSLQGYTLLVIHPQITVNTAEAYRQIIPKKPEREIWEILSLSIEDWKNTLSNDFEASVFQKFPEIASIKTGLYDLGASYASMSGSGSSVFGLYPSDIIPPTSYFPDHYQIWKQAL